LYRRNRDLIFIIFSILISISTIFIIGTLVYFLFAQGISFVHSQKDISEVFLLKDNWFPLEGEYQFLPLVVSSLFIGIGATSLLFTFSLPFSLGQNFFVRGRIKRFVDLVIVLANAIPSVVYGFWGIIIVVPLVSKFHFLGTNLLSGIIVLSFMLLPTASLLLNRVISSLPPELHLSSASLGLSLESRILKIYLPLIFKEMPSVILLSFTRAIGETIAIVMVTGNIVQFPSDIFSPVRALTSNIALEMAYATGVHRDALIFSGLLILLLIFLIMCLFKGIGYVATKKV